jgi:hypothetical protein
MATKWNHKEGFSLFAQDYFQNVERNISIFSDVSDIIKEIVKYFNQYGNPITTVDKGLETFIQELLVLLMGQADCNKDQIRDTPFLNSTMNSFTWANGALNFLSQEGFSIQEDPTLLNTLQSFMKNHPKITNMTALTNLYILQLNAYEKSIQAIPTTEQLFVFNNEFDNMLDNAETLQQLTQISKSLPKTSYPNTKAGYNSFMTESARFVFDMSNNITFYPFNMSYFPYPINLTGFQAALNGIINDDNTESLDSYLSYAINPTFGPPDPPQTASPVDANYAFSSDMTATRTVVVKEYMTYISQFFSFIVYKNQPSESHVFYSIIQTRICAAYLEYINAVEFQKYRTYSTYLTPYELAMFNHLFFISLQQDYSDTNVYNLTLGPSTSEITANQYINLSRQNVYQLVSMFTTEINKRTPYLSAMIQTNNYQPLPMDGIIIFPPMPPNNRGGPLLIEYILGVYLSPSADNNKIPSTNVSQDVLDTYATPELIECEKANQQLQNECREYAKKIKNEIYRLLIVPIIVYIIYNFYYLFFFKDCLEKDVSNGCKTPFTPIFPDWETSFHDIEKGKTNYFFEFIFKPVKILYTLLNWIKSVFRWGNPLFEKKPSLHNQAPYLFFLGTFYCVYYFILNKGNTILKVLQTLTKLQIPDVDYKGFNFKRMAEGIIVVFFVKTFFKEFAGVDIMPEQPIIGGSGGYEDEDEDVEGDEEGGETIGGALLDGIKEKIEGVGKDMSAFRDFIPLNSKKINEGFGILKSKTWINFLFAPASTLTVVIKWICTILYWVGKYIISVGLTTFSMLITFIYIIYNSLFGMSSYNLPGDTTSDKIKFINQVMYSKLCNNTNDGIVYYTFKSIFFVIIYFMIETVIIITLLKSMKEFNNMSAPMPQNGNNSNNLAVKSFMIIVYGIIFLVVGVWCMYKFNFKMPDDIKTFKAPSGNNIFNFDIVNNKDMKDKYPEDTYEKETKKGYFDILYKSNSLNKKLYTEFNEIADKKPQIKGSMLTSFISKLGSLGDKLNDSVNTNIGASLQKSYSNFKDKIIIPGSQENNEKKASLSQIGQNINLPPIFSRLSNSNPADGIKGVFGNAVDTFKNTFK